MEKRRDPAADVIRCFALFCVISVHFFSNIGFYSWPVDIPRMYVMAFVRSNFMICVPLFMLLSGYLMLHKEPNKAYFKRVWRIIWIYILASLACGLFRMERSAERGAVYPLSEMLLGILSFDTAGYSWYVEMYLGLFVLIPFINMIYHSMGSRENKRLMVFVLLLMTSVPAVVNVYNFTEPGWWSNPSSSETYHGILPFWWKSMYPVMYYVIGCYLREFPLKMKMWQYVAAIAVTAVVIGVYNCWRSHDVIYIWGPWQDYLSLFVVVQSVLVFSWLVNMKYAWIGPGFAGVLAKVSEWSLGAYLVSQIFDLKFYEQLNLAVKNYSARLEYFVIMVPAVYVCSVALSAVLDVVYKLGLKAYGALKAQS